MSAGTEGPVVLHRLSRHLTHPPGMLQSRSQAPCTSQRLANGDGMPGQSPLQNGKDVRRYVKPRLRRLHTLGHRGHGSAHETTRRSL